MGVLMGLCLAIGCLLGGEGALLPALVIGAVINFFIFVFSDRIALATARASEISADDDPVLWNIVERLCQKAELPFPRLYLSPVTAPNAFTTGRGPRHSAVCVTAGLHDMLNEYELEGVRSPKARPVSGRNPALWQNAL